MASLAALQAQTKTVTVNLGDVPLTITYRPQARTVQWETEMRSLPEDPQTFTPVYLSLVTKVIESWDLKMHEKDKEPLPITPENLSLLTMDQLYLILQGVRNDATPPQETSDPSSFA